MCVIHIKIQGLRSSMHGRFITICSTLGALYHTNLQGFVPQPGIVDIPVNGKLNWPLIKRNAVGTKIVRGYICTALVS